MVASRIGRGAVGTRAFTSSGVPSGGAEWRWVPHVTIACVVMAVVAVVLMAGLVVVVVVVVVG